MDWQPIETAPMDGTVVLVYADEHEVGWIGSAEYSLRYGCWDAIPAVAGEIYYSVNPTHWQPLPSPPSAKP